MFQTKHTETSKHIIYEDGVLTEIEFNNSKLNKHMHISQTSATIIFQHENTQIPPNIHIYIYIYINTYIYTYTYIHIWYEDGALTESEFNNSLSNQKVVKMFLQLEMEPGDDCNALIIHSSSNHKKWTHYMYIYIYIYTCIHTYVYTYMHIYIYIYICINLFIFMIWVWLCIYAYIHNYVCIYVYIYIYTHICICIKEISQTCVLLFF